MMVAVLLILMIIMIAGIIACVTIPPYLQKKFKKKHPETYRKEYDYTQDRVTDILQSVFVNYWLYGRKLLINLHYRERICVLEPEREDWRELCRTEYWTDETKANIHLAGYKKVRGMHDSILWAFVPVYMQVENASYFVVPDTKTNDKFDYPQDTAETLHDYASSNATQRFIAAMSKTSIDNIDMHTIIMIALLAVGAIFGMKMLGVF